MESMYEKLKQANIFFPFLHFVHTSSNVTRSKVLGKLSALFLIVAVIATSQIISLCLRKF